jgi:superfamily II DNA or RNA helicase
MEENQFSNIYIQTEGAWEKEGQNKFGYTGPKPKSMEKRKQDSHEQHSYLKKIVTAFKIKPTKDYLLGYKEFDEIIKLFLYKPEIIEELEKHYNCKFIYGRRLSQYKIKNGGGTEFIKIEGLETLYNFIEHEFKHIGLKVERYTEEEIQIMNETTRLKVARLEATKERERNELLVIFREIMKKKELERTSNKIILHKFQKEAIDKILEYYKTNDKAILNWICRLGKTIASIVLINKLKFSRILIGVPSTQLLYQWRDKLKLYCNHKIILVGDDNEKVINRIDNNTIVITTYSSSYKLKNIKFDFKILDEAHHLAYVDDVNIDTDGKYRAILEVESIKQLSLTATMKISDTEKINFKGNNIEEIFGKVLDVKTLGWAIENGFVCDYDICNPILDRNMVEKKLEELQIDATAELLVSCLTMLEVLKNNINTHIINYTNKINNSKKCRNIIDILLETTEYSMLKVFITNKEIISDTTKINQDDILDDYRKTKYGIIHCCYKLGEGFDEKLIDTVCISENMFSNIRIVQSLLRPHTKDTNLPDKKAMILLPMMADLEKDLEQSDKYKKLSDIIKIISSHDDNVTEKVKIIKCFSIKPKPNEEFIPVRSIFSESIILRMINRRLIGGNSYKNLKKIIKELGGRASETYLQYDYRQKSKTHNLLEVIEVENLLRKNNKTWFDLYDINTFKYPTWSNFKSNYGNIYDREKYIAISKSNNHIPQYDDLDLFYGNYGYNTTFWNKPTGCSMEF